MGHARIAEIFFSEWHGSHASAGTQRPQLPDVVVHWNQEIYANSRIRVTHVDDLHPSLRHAQVLRHACQAHDVSFLHVRILTAHDDYCGLSIA